MPRLARFVVPSSVLALVLAGCARQTPADQVLTQGALAQPGTPPAAFVAGGAAGTVTDGWLASFHDPVLDALVAEALVANPDLAAAKARVDQAAAQARLAGAELMPQISAYAKGGVGGTVESSHTTKQVGAGLSLSWEADVWGRLSSAQRAAEEGFASQQADFAFARQSLAAQVVKAWFLAIQGIQQEAIAAEFTRLQVKNADLTELRRRSGKSSGYDAALARSALSTARDNQQKAESGRESAVRSLEILLGRYPKAELTVATALPPVPAAPPAGLPSQILERRPDLVAATRRVAAAFNQTESAKAARLPRLSLTADTGVAASGFRDLSLKDVFWNLGANFIGPIFDGGRLQEQVEISTAQQAEALALYGKAALLAFQQVETALAEDHRLAQRVDLVVAADTDQAEALRLATMQYDAGRIDQLALLQVQSQALNTRLSALSVQVERLTNRVDLHLALGGGFALPPPAPEDQLPASKAVPSESAK